jgi:aldose 1-epimerase
MKAGGIIVSLTVPAKNGKRGDMVLGYDTLNDYIGSTPYFGALESLKSKIVCR